MFLFRLKLNFGAKMVAGAAVVGFMTVILSGCQTYAPFWVQEGKSKKEFNQDVDACVRQSEKPGHKSIFNWSTLKFDTDTYLDRGLFYACMGGKQWEERFLRAEITVNGAVPLHANGFTLPEPINQALKDR